MTPHSVILFDKTGTHPIREFPSNGTIRLETMKQEIFVHPLSEEIPTYAVTRSKGNGYVPPEAKNTYFIVSAMVQEAYPERKDFIAPNTSADSTGAVRDDKGAVIGVKSFIIND